MKSAAHGIALTLVLALGCHGHPSPGDQAGTDGSSRESEFLAVPRAEILLVGTFHFSDPGLDSYKPEFDIDILSDERQLELDEILDGLAGFEPTKIAIEWRSENQERADREYRSYLDGQLTLTSDEVHQIAFRLAKRLGLPGLHAVDAEPRWYEPWVDPDESAKQHGQEQLVEREERWNERFNALYKHDDAAKVSQTLREHFLYMNSEDRIRQGHGHYLVGTFAAGSGDDFAGADSTTAWYNRNLRILANLQRITESPDDRILLLIGAGHLPILRHAIQASPEYDLVELRDCL